MEASSRNPDAGAASTKIRSSSEDDQECLFNARKLLPKEFQARGHLLLFYCAAADCNDSLK